MIVTCGNRMGRIVNEVLASVVRSWHERVRRAGYYSDCNACELILFCVSGTPDRISQCPRCGLTEIEELVLVSGVPSIWATAKFTCPVSVALTFSCPCVVQGGTHTCARRDEIAFRRGRRKKR
jgi:hypothetical protein